MFSRGVLMIAAAASPVSILADETNVASRWLEKNFSTVLAVIQVFGLMQNASVQS